MRPIERITTAARIFSLAAVAGLAFISDEPDALLSLVLVGFVALAATYITLTTVVPALPLVMVEAVTVSLALGIAFPAGAIILPYFMAIPLLAGLSRGVVGVGAASATQLGFILLMVATMPGPSVGEAQIHAFAPWFVTSLLSGLLGTWIRGGTWVTREAHDAESYESARRLIAQLREITEQLSDGLDAHSIAQQIIAHVNKELGYGYVSVYSFRGPTGMYPVAHSDPACPSQDVSLAQIDVNGEEPSVVLMPGHGGRAALVVPLRLGHRSVGVVVAGPARQDIALVSPAFAARLNDYALRLETALAFDEVRALATTEERNRLAREIHDGVAQEVASLGYLVDELIAGARPESNEAASLSLLRQELSRVVTELRLSIFDLRSQTLSTTTLGAALSDYVRKIRATSGLQVHLTLDESAQRLRPDVEAELLRIAGEAINNARRHSEAQNLWVNCSIRPPEAEIDILDDGEGLKATRAGSFGLRIMKERADRLNARLTIVSPASGSSGTRVTVVLGRPVTSREEEHVATNGRRVSANGTLASGADRRP